MTLSLFNRLALFAGTALIGFTLVASPARAVMEEGPLPPKPPATTEKKTDSKKTKAPETTTKKKEPEKKSGREFLDGYKVAYDLIQSGQYEAGIAAMHALGHDEHADVATGIGYAWRKLGDYDKSKFWYDKALATDPKHVVTLSYYGMWYAEQGNVLKAEDFLKKIRVACGGPQCEPYKSLKGVIDGKFTY